MAKKSKVTQPEQNIWFDLAVGIWRNGFEIDWDATYVEMSRQDRTNHDRAVRALRWLAAKKEVDVIAAKEIAQALWG